MRIENLKCSPRKRGVCKLGGWKGGFVAVVICVATAVASHEQTFTSLVSFEGSNGKLS